MWHNQTLGRCCSPRWCSCQIQCRCSGSDLLWYQKNSYSGPCRCAQTLSRIPRKICWGSLSWSHLQSSRRLWCWCKFYFRFFFCMKKVDCTQKCLIKKCLHIPCSNFIQNSEKDLPRKSHVISSWKLWRWYKFRVGFAQKMSQFWSCNRKMVSKIDPFEVGNWKQSRCWRRYEISM